MSASILIADDEPGIRDLLCWELGAEGHDVTAAIDGADALEQMRRTEFDILISDVRMPRVGGLEVLRASKTTAPDTEVIIATGHAELEYAIECVRQGAFDFLQKPFQTAELLATVLRALERRRLRCTAGLYETSRAILDGQEPQRLPELIVRLAMDAMNADDASLMLPDAHGTLHIAHSHSLSPEVAAEVRLRLGDRIAGRVASLGEPALIPHAIAADPRFCDLISTGRVRSSIVYPLLSRKRVAGVLSISRVSESSRPFRKADLERAAILASQALLALENARLIRNVASSERLASVGLLATGVAHEINNPAACVLANHSYLEEQLSTLGRLGSLLDSGADAPALRRSWASLGGTAFLSEIQQALGDLGAGASAIRDIARDMKALGRQDETKPVIFDLNEAIRTAVRITGAEIKHVAIVRMDLAAALEILGSPVRISQVFVNLLLNAAQAFAEARDARQHEIVIRSWRETNQVIASVTDDGPGIRPEYVACIFDRFFTTKEATAGTGLGLAITHEIVVSHGGDLRVESTPGRGATFTIRLPFATTPAPSLAFNAPATPTLPETAGAVAKRCRILFIDDERGILKSYERAFAKDNDVTVTDGGEQALAILSTQWDFDLVVCDLLMPDINGLEVFRRAREAHPELDGRFVFVTGGETTQDVQSFLRSVGNQVLEKPFDFSAVREIIAARSRPS